MADFAKNKGTLDGRINQCKECVKIYHVTHRAANLEKIRASDCIRSKSPERRAWIKESFKRYEDRNPGKHAARVAVKNAVRDGRLKKLPCMVCGDKSEAHHPDYSRPLDVVWLCAMHHRETHALVKG